MKESSVSPDLWLAITPHPASCNNTSSVFLTWRSRGVPFPVCPVIYCQMSLLDSKHLIRGRRHGSEPVN